MYDVGCSTPVGLLVRAEIMPKRKWLSATNRKKCIKAKNAMSGDKKFN